MGRFWPAGRHLNSPDLMYLKQLPTESHWTVTGVIDQEMQSWGKMLLDIMLHASNSDFWCIISNVLSVTTNYYCLTEIFFVSCIVCSVNSSRWWIFLQMNYSHLHCFPFQGKCPGSAKSTWDMAVNEKVTQKQGGGMSTDRREQPSPCNTVH